MPRKILLIKHNDAPNDDRTATHLAARGVDLEWRRPFAGEPLPPDVDGLAGLIVHGGAQPVPETDRYPFLRDEMRFMGRCLAYIIDDQPAGPFVTVIPTDIYFFAVLSASESSVRWGDRAPWGAIVIYTRMHGDVQRP